MLFRFALLMFVLSQTVNGHTQPHARLQLNLPAVAKKIVERLDVQNGEKMILVTYPDTFEELIPHLRYEIAKNGGVDLGVIEVLKTPYPESWDETAVQSSARLAREAYRNMFSDIDASIMLPGALPRHPPYAALQDLLRQGQGRMIHFHWLENGSAFAIAGQPLPAAHVIDATYQKALLNVDYRTIALKQQSFEQAMRNAEVRVSTPAGTDIRFRIGDRPVNRQDGDASRSRTDKGVILIDHEIELPCGAVRVAPLEETVNGVIAFPPSQWNGRAVNGLKLSFEKGRVVSVAAESGKENVLAEMDRGGEAGRRFREFALGFNPELTVPEMNPWIPYYGYGAGVVRLSLGDNSELGGAVSGGYVRWNFFTDATVTVGGQTWVKNGRLVR